MEIQCGGKWQEGAAPHPLHCVMNAKWGQRWKRGQRRGVQAPSASPPAALAEGCEVREAGPDFDKRQVGGRSYTPPSGPGGGLPNVNSGAARAIFDPKTAKKVPF